MIVDSGKYFLYRHIRLDKDEPFYIGIGTKDYTKSEYMIYFRAFRKSSRNKIWRSIVNRTKYEVEILLESDNYDFIENKEIEFIKLYGRIDRGTGCLSNLTDGGGTSIVYERTPEFRKKMSNLIKGTKRKPGVTEKINQTKSQRIYKSRKGIKFPKWVKDKIAESQFKAVIQMDLNNNIIREFISIKQAGETLNIQRGSISQACNNKLSKAGGFKWRFK